MPTLEPVLFEDLRRRQREMQEEGKLLSYTQLSPYYETFRKRFGPDVLAGLDGEVLLDYLHSHGNRDSLVYWLEFKDDDELPAIFGSIAGGSALKFGVYRRRETGMWLTGTPQAQQELTLEQAIGIARRNRDELIRGCQLLEKLPLVTDLVNSTAVDAAYSTLQMSMDQEVKNVSNFAWGHKYFSMLFPEKLDDYHSTKWQRHHLYCLLQSPPVGAGRYLPAGRYVMIANDLDLPLNSMAKLLNQRNGPPRDYWRVGTTDDENKRRKYWPLMLNTPGVAVGWPQLGDLSSLTHDLASKEVLREKLRPYYPDDPQTLGRQLQQLFNFRHWLKEGEIVLAADGATILGIGQVTGGYRFDPEHCPGFPHWHEVKWLDQSEWKLPNREGLMTTLALLNKPETIIAIERKLLEASPPPIITPTVTLPPPITTSEMPPIVPTTVRRPDHLLDGLAGRMQSLLERKGQIILYGPPGTGKTFHAEATARELAAWASFGVSFAALNTEQNSFILGKQGGFAGTVRLCCFHPAYGYEDFLEGYRPEATDAGLAFRMRDGVFKRLCMDALEHPEDRFYLIIDEINRGDIPRIFGELMTVVEKSRRGTSIQLPLSGKAFSVPDNVYLIGTMNTADRSIALLDTALRRRFGFLELMPDPALLGKAVLNGIPLAPWLDALNRRICKYVGRDARNLQVGHAYLMERGVPISDFSRFVRVVQEELIPLLEEYCYEDYTALEQILGKSLVDLANQRIVHELFYPEKGEALIAALLQPSPELSTSSQSVQSVEVEGPEAEIEE